MALSRAQRVRRVFAVGVEVCARCKGVLLPICRENARRSPCRRQASSGRGPNNGIRSGRPAARLGAVVVGVDIAASLPASAIDCRRDTYVFECEGLPAGLLARFEALLTAQNKSGDPARTPIPATFLRIAVAGATRLLIRAETRVA